MRARSNSSALRRHPRATVVADESRSEASAGRGLVARHLRGRAVGVMGGDLCADFLKGACHRPGCRYSHADPNGRARGDGAPSGQGFGFGAGAPSEAKGFGGFEAGFGVAEKQVFFNDAPRGAGAWAQKPTPGDWLCGRCDSLNFKKRDDCNRCRASRSLRAMDITPANVDEYVRRRERQAARQRRRAERRERNGGVSVPTRRRGRDGDGRRRRGDGDGDRDGDRDRDGDGDKKRRRRSPSPSSSSSSYTDSDSYTDDSYSSSYSSSTGSETRERRRVRRKRREEASRRDGVEAGTGTGTPGTRERPER